MSPELGPQLLADFILALVVGVVTRRDALRALACLGIPCVVSLVALGGKFPSSIADGGGFFYIIFAYFAFWGLIVSLLGCGLGYLIRRALKLKV